MSSVIKEYDCPKCGVIEIVQEHTKTSKKCPTCKCKIERLISRPLIAKDKAPRTVGTLLEQNNKKNKLEREKTMGNVTEKKLERESFYRKLANASPEMKKRYIEKGIL